jgi:hypothetical protein
LKPRAFIRSHDSTLKKDKEDRGFKVPEKEGLTAQELRFSINIMGRWVLSNKGVSRSNKGQEHKGCSQEIEGAGSG